MTNERIPNTPPDPAVFGDYPLEAGEQITVRRLTMFAGYRTYVVAFVLFGIGAAQAVGFPIPEEVWMMLGAVGLGTLRAAVEGK
jgi:hypothetical protein